MESAESGTKVGTKQMLILRIFSEQNFFRPVAKIIEYNPIQNKGWWRYDNIKYGFSIRGEKYFDSLHTYYEYYYSTKYNVNYTYLHKGDLNNCPCT